MVPVREAYPNALSHQQAGAAARYSHASGTWPPVWAARERWTSWKVAASRRRRIGCFR